MLIAVLESARGSIKRDIEFSRGAFYAEGLGELSVEELRELDANNQLEWVCNDTRSLTLGYSSDSGLCVGDGLGLTDEQLQLPVETEVVYVPAHRMGSKTEAELHRIVSDMIARGWLLVEDTRIGAAGGHLTFHRAEPLDPALLAACSLAG
jgi:hypothetical protein